MDSRYLEGKGGKCAGSIDAKGKKKGKREARVVNTEGAGKIGRGGRAGKNHG
jgi:hypothetical protein